MFKKSKRIHQLSFQKTIIIASVLFCHIVFLVKSRSMKILFLLGFYVLLLLIFQNTELARYNLKSDYFNFCIKYATWTGNAQCSIYETTCKIRKKWDIGNIFPISSLKWCFLPHIKNSEFSERWKWSWALEG